jgi:hypothetical protein
MKAGTTSLPAAEATACRSCTPWQQLLPHAIQPCAFFAGVMWTGGAQDCSEEGVTLVQTMQVGPKFLR